MSDWSSRAEAYRNAPEQREGEDLDLIVRWADGSRTALTRSGAKVGGKVKIAVLNDSAQQPVTLTTGNNAVLEVFMIQSGSSVKVYLETEVYGSDTAAVPEQIITLTGVTVAELTLANGIITAA